MFAHSRGFTAGPARRAGKVLWIAAAGRESGGGRRLWLWAVDRLSGITMNGGPTCRWLKRSHLLPILRHAQAASPEPQAGTHPYLMD